MPAPSLRRTLELILTYQSATDQNATVELLLLLNHNLPLKVLHHFQV